MAIITENALKNFIVSTLATTLELEECEIETDTTFDVYGVDSLIAAEVIYRIEILLGRNLSGALFFEHPSVDQLATYLLQVEG